MVKRMKDSLMLKALCAGMLVSSCANTPMLSRTAPIRENYIVQEENVSKGEVALKEWERVKSSLDAQTLESSVSFSQEGYSVSDVGRGFEEETVNYDAQGSSGLPEGAVRYSGGEAGLLEAMKGVNPVVEGSVYESSVENGASVYEPPKVDSVEGGVAPEGIVGETSKFNGEVYTPQEHIEMQRILYAEAANQSPGNRRLVARCIVNRVESDDYPDRIHDVIYQRNAFSCVNGKGSEMWNQSGNRDSRNGYEEKVFGRCGENVRDVLDGEMEGIVGENKIIAYHDISIDKPTSSYWDSLEEVHRSERLIFYKDKD